MLVEFEFESCLLAHNVYQLQGSLWTMAGPVTRTYFRGCFEVEEAARPEGPSRGGFLGDG